jgi:beta-lactamase class A
MASAHLKFIVFYGSFLIMQAAKGIDPQSSPSISFLRQQIEQRLADEEGNYAIAFKDLQSGIAFFRNEKNIMHAASTMKLAVMIEVFKQAAEGKLSLQDSIQVLNRFQSIVDGSTYALDLHNNPRDFQEKDLDRKIAVEQLVYKMITVSSNLAANLLIDKVGIDEINATMRGIGAENLQILRGVEDLKAYNQGLQNKTDAYSLMIILESLAGNRVISGQACAQMIAILLKQEFRDRIPALLPAGIKVAHKTGSISKINHDAGVIFLPDERKYILVVLSEGVDDRAKSSKVIAEVSRLVYDWMIGK